MTYYFQETNFQKAFYLHYRKSGAVPLFPLSSENERYLWMRDMTQRLQPFQFLKRGDYAIQVGFTSDYLEIGLSHPLIMASIVGERGRVRAIDADRRNVDALLGYAERNRIGHISMIHDAVWKEEAPVSFAIYDRSSTNTADPVIKEAEAWFDERVPDIPTHHVAMDATTLDAIIVDAIGTGRTPDFINLTVNGAEGACLRGAVKLIERNPRVIFAFPAGNVKKEDYDWLESLGFDIGLSHAPHAPWEKGFSLYACAMRDEGLGRLRMYDFEPLEGGLESLTWDGKRMF